MDIIATTSGKELKEKYLASQDPKKILENITSAK